MSLAFVSCDTPHFAPKAESVDITYRIPDDVDAAWVELQIRDNRNNLVFTDRTRPDRTRFRWDGSIRPEGTEPRTRWVNPLASPFTIQVVIKQENDGQPPPGSSFRRNTKRSGVVVSCQEREQARVVPQATSATVKVLYHGIEIVLCPWTLELLGSSELDQDELRSLLLNERGYYAGPPLQAGRRQELQRALRRFQFNNRGARAPRSAPVDSLRDQEQTHVIMEAPALFAPISKASGERLEPGRPLPSAGSGNGPLRIRSEAIGFDADYTKDEDEFAAQLGLSGKLRHKWDFEAEKLNRPLLPLLARITLRGRNGEQVDVPEAVGPAKVRWSVEEPDPDTSTLAFAPDQRSRPKVFVSGLLQSLKKNQGSMNCPEECGGVRTQKPALDVFVLGTDFPGFNARPDTKPDGVYTIASFDLNRPLVRGQAGIFFQPSNIAGDQYRLKAEIDLAGTPAARDHGALGYRTEVLQVWRSVKLSAVVGWPQRGEYQRILSRVAQEYQHSFIELDLSRTHYLAIEDFFRQEEYSKWLQHYFSIHDMEERDPRRSSLHSEFSPDALFRPAPALNMQGKAYFVTVMTTILHEAVVSKGRAPSIRFLADLILARLHRTYADFRVGIVLLDYLLPQEVFDTRDEIGFGDATLSVGLNALFALTDQVVQGSPYHIFAHEIGHCFWLCHHENAGDKHPEDHDPLDHGCIMSYPKENGTHAHQHPSSYQPHFCGKCLFKLRGWNIRSQLFAETAKQAHEDSLKVVVYYDAAEKELQGDVEAKIVEHHLKPWSFGERVLIRSVDRDIKKKTQQWKEDLSDCDVYHHVSHGNIYHEGKKVRAHTLEFFTPKYPLGVGTPGSESEAELDLFTSNREKGPGWYRDVSNALLRPMEQLSGVMQWASSGYMESSKGDVMFGRDMVQQLPAVPRTLALLSCCLVGWNPNLAKAFLDRGTKYVIAFRARYLSGHAVPFSETFYKAWSRLELSSSGLQTAFIEAAEQFPHAEPVLFSQNQIIRVWATKKEITHPSEDVKLEILDWTRHSQEAFMAPHFHDIPTI